MLLGAKKHAVLFFLLAVEVGPQKSQINGFIESKFRKSLGEYSICRMVMYFLYTRADHQIKGNSCNLLCKFMCVHRRMGKY